MITLILLIIGLILVVMAVVFPSLAGLFAVLAVFFFIFSFFGLALRFLGKAAEKEKAKADARTAHIMETYLDAGVTLKSIRDTGITINNDPKIAVVLDILLSDGETYRLERSEVVSRVYLGSISVGREYDAKVNPEDREDIIVDWSGQFISRS